MLQNLQWVENTLVRDVKFRLPGKKVLLSNDMPMEVILIDAIETPIERPKKKGRGIKSELSTGITDSDIITLGKRSDTH